MKESRARRLIVALAMGAAAILPITLVADGLWSSGPADGFTGAPGEGTCRNCHQFGPGDGTMQLVGIPAIYHADQAYNLTVQLQDPGQKRWGFELTAIDGNGDGAGSFAVTDPVNTQLSDNNPPSARDYVKHTSTGTHNGTLNGPIQWQITWNAPSISTGPVTFYAAGNAADGDGTTLGNYIYTTSATAQPSAFDVPSLDFVSLTIMVFILAIAGALVLRMRLAPASKRIQD